MKRKWKAIRSIIESYGPAKEDLFLTLVNSEGVIISANATMTKSLQLVDVEGHKTRFIDLIHPYHVKDFENLMHEARVKNIPATLELYIRNGYYHPMKWQINSIRDTEEDEDAYLCIGQKILDDKRLAKFNSLGEKNYQLIMEGMQAGIIFQDDRGEIIAANQKIAEMLDVTLERLYQLSNIQESWNKSWSITTEDGIPVLFNEAPFSKALQTGQAHEQTMVIRLKNGQYRWLHYLSQPLFEGECNKPYAVVSNILNVTDKKELTTELEERDAVFNNFLQQTPNLAWVVDDQTRLVFASSAFYDYFGLQPHLAVNEKIGDIVPPEVANALFVKHLEVLQTGKPVDVVEKTRWANGSTHIFHITLFPIQGLTNKRMVGGHAVNVAEKYAVEKKLRETNDRLLLLTRATNDAIWEWDMKTGQIFRNDALMDMIGYQLDNPRGLSWWLRRIHPEDRERVSDKVKITTENGQQSWVDEYRFKCADGTFKNMRDRGYIVYENGLPVKMIGSLQDITDIRTLEDRLLDEKIQRQKEISETVIRVQEKERTRIGHELHDNINQILSTTKLFIDMLTPPTEQEKKIKEKSINYLVMAIEEIRKLSRELVAPQLKEKRIVDSIQTLIDDIHLSTRVRIGFTYDLEQEKLSPGIKVTLFRIIQEQLKNILKHSRATEVNICLQCRQGETKLIIRDNGIGFDANQTRRGIGLSNIYERTRFYNGTVNIETAAAKGCELTVSIPVE